MDQQQIEILKQALHKEILSLITEQKTALIKAGPGKDKDIASTVDDLHAEIRSRLDIIRILDENRISN